jgi:hypothetical protein
MQIVLSQLRTKAGVSQTELAKRIDWNQSEISRMEKEDFLKLRLGDVVNYIRGLDGYVQLHLGVCGESNFEQEFQSGTRVVATTGAREKSATAPEAVEREFTLKERHATSPSRSDDDRNSKLPPQIGRLESEITELKSEKASLEESLRSHQQELAVLRRQLEQRPEPSRELLEQLGQVQAEFKVAWKLMHQGQRLQVQDRLLSDEQRNQRAAMVHAGRSAPPLPLPTSLR